MRTPLRWRNRGLAVAAVALAGAVSCAPPPALPRPTAPALPATLRISVAGHITTVPLEVYVVGTALSEIVPTGETDQTVERIYEVQTILARTYAVAHLGRHRAEGYDLCDGTHCQVYDPARLRTSRFAAAAARAAARTRGQIIWYGDRPAEALYHADSGGRTAAPEDVWGSTPVPYLRSLPDLLPGLVPREWNVTISRETLTRALDLDAATAVGNRLDDVSVATRDTSGRAAMIRLSGARTTVVRGEEFRAVLNRTLGAHGVLSTMLTISRHGSQFVIDGSGYGHGVGLSQVGALARARNGATTAEILAHYFPGTHLGS